MDFLTPEFFDALIIANIVIGLAIAGRRLRRDIRGPPAGRRSGMGARSPHVCLPQYILRS